MTPSKVRRTRVKKSSDGSHSRNSAGTTRKTPSMKNILSKVTEQADKTSDRTSYSPAAHAKPMLLFSSADHLIGKVPHDYTVLSMAVEVLGWPRVVDSRRPACFCSLGTGERYEHVITFLRQFFIRALNRLIIFVKAIGALSAKHDMGLRHCECRL